MLRTRQKVNAQGIQIPLAFVEQYGLVPGAEVMVEFGPDGIFLAPAMMDARKIETQALHLLLRKVGDAVKVRVHQQSEAARGSSTWCVEVYGSDDRLLLGQLIYTADGEYLPEYSTSFETMRHKAIAAIPA